MYKSILFLKSLIVLLSLSFLHGVLYALPAKSPSIGFVEPFFMAFFEGGTAGDGEPKKEAVFLQQMLGAEFEAITFDEAQEMDLMGGVLIKKITSGPLSQQSFMKEGFVITKINGEEVFTIRRLYNVLKKNPQRIRFEGKYNDLLMAHDSFSGNYTYLLILNEKW